MATKRHLFSNLHKWAFVILAMKIKMQPAYFIAFLALNMVVSELHEMAHFYTGYLVCSCYGTRDFNVWSLCSSCRSPYISLPSIAGPLLSYSVMWLGIILTANRNSDKSKALGFSFVFAAMPFARIFTAMMGGGDEKITLLQLTGGTIPFPLLKLLAFIMVVLICLPPVIIVFRRMQPGSRIITTLSMCFIPMFTGFLLTHNLYNVLLKKDFLVQTLFGGTPLLIQIHFMLMILLLVLFKKNLLLILVPKSAECLKQ